MSETLGARIRRLRQCYGMSQAELARRIGVTANGMNRIESGETPDPRASRIKRIADVLDISADVVLGRDTDQESEECLCPDTAARFTTDRGSSSPAVPGCSGRRPSPCPRA